jgi:ATP-dependent helicase IRC3
MEVIASNKEIQIVNPTSDFLSKLKPMLTYTDKSKQYQLQKMKKNPFTRNSPYIKKLEKEVTGNLINFIDDNHISIPSGFIHIFDSYEDNREFTGEDISLPWKNKPFDMRDYQEEAVDLMVNSYRGIVELATGMGKTLTAVHAIRRIKKKTLIVCPNVSIANNFYNELVEAFGELKVGYVGGGKNKIKDITVGIAQSVVNRIDKFDNLGLIIFDEVHHLAADTFFSIADNLGDVGQMFGLTATAFRSDGKDVLITAGVGEALIKRDLVWGIKHGWLSQPVFISRNINTTGKNYKNDKLKNYKEHVLKSQQLNEQLVGDINAFTKIGKSVLCLVSEISHGEILAEETGLDFANGKNKESDKLVDLLNKGKIPGLIGTGSYIGEGTDTKNVDVLILANFVANKGTLWQNIGRGLRIHEGKDRLIVIDYVPLGSEMLTRHANKRIQLYQEITDKVKIV